MFVLRRRRRLQTLLQQQQALVRRLLCIICVVWSGHAVCAAGRAGVLLGLVGSDADKEITPKWLIKRPFARLFSEWPMKNHQ